MNRTERGSIVVETAAASFLAVTLMAGSLLVGRSALRVRRTHALARLAASLSSAGAPANVVEAEVRDYAARMGQPDTTLTLGRYDRSSAALFYRLVEASVETVAAVPPAFGGEQRIRARAVLEEDRP